MPTAPAPAAATPRAPSPAAAPTPTAATAWHPAAAPTPVRAHRPASTLLHLFASRPFSTARWYAARDSVAAVLGPGGEHAGPVPTGAGVACRARSHRRAGAWRRRTGAPARPVRPRTGRSFGPSWTHGRLARRIGDLTIAVMAADRPLPPVALLSRSPSDSRRLVALAVAAIAILATLVAAPGRAGATSVDPYGDELMRLTNLDRAALGKATLAIDPILASFARDLTWTCPTNGSLVFRGRAADMAERSYFSHYVGGCLTTGGVDMSALDVMGQVLGYLTTRGENIAWNTYPTADATYAYGCAIDGTGCSGTTTTPTTVEVAERGFMQSSGHRANILGAYDRFGCGSSLALSGRRYYACVFSLGGPAATPTPTPDPAPTPGPTPTPDPLPQPAVVPDTSAPVFVKLSGTSTVRAGSSRRIGTTVTDDVALARLAVKVDGRRLRVWTPGGIRAERSVLVSASRLGVGRHLVRWRATDQAGNVRIRTWWLVVRRSVAPVAATPRRGGRQASLPSARSCSAASAGSRNQRRCSKSAPTSSGSSAADGSAGGAARSTRASSR